MVCFHVSIFPERGKSVGRRMVAFAMALVGVYPQYRSCRFVTLVINCPILFSNLFIGCSVLAWDWYMGMWWRRRRC